MKHCLIQLQKIQAQVSRKCIKKVCRDGKCSLSLQKLDPAQFLLLSMDGPGAPVQRSESRCDFLFFGCFSQEAEIARLQRLLQERTGSP